jgi:alcohol dehydrogenase class IV
MNQYYNPVRIFQGAGCAGWLEHVLDQMNLVSRKVLFLVWDESVLNHPSFAPLLDEGRGYEIHPLCFRESNPTVEQLFRVYQETKAWMPEVVVAVGGGSILDVGKSLCCLYRHTLQGVEELRELIQTKDYGSPAARWIGIPTTAGTGSETTCWATIWDPEQNTKRSVECRENYAWAALVDPELAAGMPLQLAVSSALDAVAHAVESYWAKGTNCVSRGLALEAIRTIMGNIDNLMEGKKEAHDAMARGSMLAGLAFSNTRTTACHSISYPLTMRYHIPHGTAVSLLLAPVMQLNASCVEGMKELLDALGVESTGELQGRIAELLGRSGQGSSLQEWGVKYQDLAELAPLGITKGRADNNPVVIQTATVQRILEEAYTLQPMRKGA